MAPVVHGLEDKWDDQVEFIFLDIDDPQTTEYKRQLGYQYQPHILLLDADGNILNQWVGYTDGQTLQAAIQQAVQ